MLRFPSSLLFTIYLSLDRPSFRSRIIPRMLLESRILSPMSPSNDRYRSFITMNKEFIEEFSFPLKFIHRHVSSYLHLISLFIRD